MKRVLFLLLLCGLIGIPTYAQTPISGTIASDSSWTKANSPYIITGTLQISAGVTLTIDSSEVLFETNSGILVHGNLNANIVNFTSAQASKQNGDWNSIEFRSTAEGDFFGCSLAFGGRSAASIHNGTLDVNGGTVAIDSTTIYNSRNAGIVVRSGANVEMGYHSSLLSNTYPIVYRSNANVTFDHKDIEIINNSFNGAFLHFNYLNADMHLDTLSVPYVVNTTLYVQSGHNLSISSDNVIKFNNSSLIVRGGINAEAGTDPGSTIHFTSYKNDNLGGDTNNNGTANIPGSRDWGYVKFESGSDDPNCLLRRCELSYGGGGNHGVVWIQNAAPTIDECDFRNNYIGCKMEGNSTPNFTNNLIGSSDLVPLALTFDANPNFVNNAFSFSDNQYDAIGILGSTLVSSATLPQRDVTGIPNVTYLMLGRVIIPEGMTLTIDPGIVIKGINYNDRIIVKGVLKLDGKTEEGRITITSVEDDNFGNPADTNKDGTQTDPAIGDWGGIMFEGTSSDAECIVNYTRLQYARMPSSYYNTRYIHGATISMENASPQISNNIIKDCDYGVYAFQSSNPDVLNNEFTNINYTPVALSVNANPVFSGNTFVNEGWTALGIIGEKLGFDGNIFKRNIAGHTNITYVLLENLTINSGTKLDIAPGVVIKVNNNQAIFVNGGFKAEGLANDSIVFTSINDDNYGVPKDTKNDGDAASPSAGNWRTIQFTSTADDTYNLIKYCRLLYGGNSSYGMVTFTDAGGTILYTDISDSHYYGLKFEGAASPDCGGEPDGNGIVTLSNCRLDPIAMSLSANPTMSIHSPLFLSRGNGSNGILILEGTLNTSTTLEQMDVGGIYNIAFIIDQLTIGSGAVLTFEPGVVIKFRNYYSYINVHGALVADGFKENPIVFTSIKDDSKGGDTNDDGNASVPTRNNWRFIKFNSSSLESQNLLQNCILNYGGWSSSWSNGKNRSNIIVTDSYAEIDSCSIEHCAYTGLGVFGNANPVVTNNVFANIGEVPVILSMFAEPVFADNEISNIGIRAIGVARETYALDDIIPQRNFAGFTNMTYYIYQECTVNSGTTLSIPAGTVFKSYNSDKFVVNGALRSLGTEASPVVFTHLRDDMYGNPMDTNDDGAESSPAIINQPAITYNDISLDEFGLVDYTIFKYHRSGVNLEQASPVIQNSLFNFCNWGVELRGVSKPDIVNNVFNDLTHAPLYSSLVSYPEVASGNEILGTTYKAIGVLSGEELVQDVTLERKTFADVENIPYYFHGNYSIGTSVVLTINPGVVCKFNRGARLTVKRGLWAVGKEGADSTVVFTDIRDDYYQGDTNSDGDATHPAAYYPWYGIVFADESFDALCRIEHSVIRYAGYSGSHAAILTQTASPTILNSSITKSRRALRAEGASNPTINYCDISGNAVYGVENVNKAFTIDATNNFWGSNTGPTHPSNPDGTGDAITDMVAWDPYLSNGFTLPEMGDVSLNGIVQAFDASLVLKYAVDPVTYPLSATQLGVSDVDDNDAINANDASLILQFAAGMIQTFPAELKSGEISAEPEMLEFTVDQIEVNPGSAFNLPVYVNNATELKAVDALIYFDPSVMEVLDVNLSMGSSALIASKIDNTLGEIKVAIAAAGPVTNDGILLMLNAKAVDEEGAHTAVVIDELLANGNDGTHDIVNGTVDVQIITGVGENEIAKVVVHPIYPNPATDHFKVSYSVKSANTLVNIGVYQMNGALLLEVVNDYQSPGHYQKIVNELNGLQGTYVVKIVIGNVVKNQLVVIQ
ncbi:T9SS type A sorting domain-containing protein [Labilibacter sediminis]|nr:T9SS type A sorting domain-containing protein [Labilibacter sediminis]